MSRQKYLAVFKCIVQLNIKAGINPLNYIAIHYAIISNNRLSQPYHHVANPR